MQVWESRFFRTTSTYVKLGRSCLLVDPNYTEAELHSISSFVHARHRESDIHLVCTHADFDHIPGPAFFPGATVYASNLFKNERLKEKSLHAWKQFDLAHGLTREKGYHFPEPEVYFSKTGDIFRIGGHQIRVLPAPGHTADSCFVLVPELGICIAGDYLSNIEIPLIEDCITAYAKSIKLFEKVIGQFEINYLVPGHGDIAWTKADVAGRIADAGMYLSELVDTEGGFDSGMRSYWERRYPREDFHSFHSSNIRSLKAR